MRFQPLHRTIVAFDVVGSGARDDQLLLRMRADLRAVIGDVLAQQSLDLASLDSSDLGDGLRLFVPPAITPRAVLDPFIPNLDSALREHRKAASEAARLRLRVAVHHGLVHHDGTAWTGEPLVLVSRLLDAVPVRQAISMLPDARLVLVVSEAVHSTVVRHGYGLDPSSYRQVSIREKETKTSAWIHVPGFALPVEPEHTQTGSSTTTEPVASGDSPAPSGERYVIDLRSASGVQIGHDNAQHNYFGPTA